MKGENEENLRKQLITGAVPRWQSILKMLFRWLKIGKCASMLPAGVFLYVAVQASWVRMGVEVWGLGGPRHHSCRSGVCLSPPSFPLICLFSKHILSVCCVPAAILVAGIARWSLLCSRGDRLEGHRWDSVWQVYSGGCRQNGFQCLAWLMPSWEAGCFQWLLEG